MLTSILVGVLSQRLVFERMSRFELLVADVLHQHGQTMDTLMALQRASCDRIFSRALIPSHFILSPAIFWLVGEDSSTIASSLPSVRRFADIEANLLSLYPHVLHMLLADIRFPLEALKSAATRMLEFIVSTLGCRSTCSSPIEPFSL